MKREVIMLDTLQGKHGLLVEEELYSESDIINEGFTVDWLLQNNKAALFKNEYKTLTIKEMIQRNNSIDYGGKTFFDYN